MKKITKLLTIIIACLLSLSVNISRAKAQPVMVSMQVFYDELSPYGDWIYDGAYGYVWIPNEVDFHPYYTNGYWEMTAYGNTWISLYPWGWAPFHYGRWTYDPYYGWIWVPGYEWAPAWVCWRYGGGFYGWAPLGPNFIITIGFRAYNCPYNWWVFTPHHHLYGPRNSTNYSYNRSRHYVRKSNIINNTRMDSDRNAIYTTGPTAEDVRRLTGENVIIKEISNAATPGQAKVSERGIEIYHPQVEKDVLQERKLQPQVFDRAPRSIKGQQPVRVDWDGTPRYRKDIVRRRLEGEKIEYPQENNRQRQTTQPQGNQPRQRTPEQKQPVIRRQEQPRQKTTVPRNTQQRTRTEKQTTPAKPANRR